MYVNKNTRKKLINVDFEIESDLFIILPPTCLVNITSPVKKFGRSPAGALHIHVVNSSSMQP